MQFYTYSGERMRISSTGCLGIGTASPSSRLDIEPLGWSRVSDLLCNQQVFIRVYSAEIDQWLQGRLGCQLEDGLWSLTGSAWTLFLLAWSSSGR